MKKSIFSISNYSGMEVRKGFVSTGEIDVSSLKINLYYNTFYNGSDIVTRSFLKR